MSNGPSKDIFTLPTHDLELNRSYGPDVVLWRLTPLGLKRVTEGTVPTRLPWQTDRVLRLLQKLGYAEEDELANHLDLSPKAIARALARLGGFGYVQRVQTPSQGAPTPEQI